jgi:hypothetical protein
LQQDCAHSIKQESNPLLFFEPPHSQYDGRTRWDPDRTQVRWLSARQWIKFDSIWNDREFASGKPCHALREIGNALADADIVIHKSIRPSIQSAIPQAASFGDSDPGNNFRYMGHATRKTPDKVAMKQECLQQGWVE